MSMVGALILINNSYLLAAGDPYPDHGDSTHAQSGYKNPDTGSGHHRSSNDSADNNMFEGLHNFLAFMKEDYGVPSRQNMIHIKSARIADTNPRFH